MREIIVVVDILAAVGLVALVLLQQGKGADMGAAFGSGASQTLFGSRGTANFLTRTTAVLALVFFVANLVLAYLATAPVAPGSVATQTSAPVSTPALEVPTPPAAPAIPATPQPPKAPEVPK
ncbi:MAG TPA: preprotein translocase subunit SecG [Burkholderiales bacterium]|jgi:preprotein translocase subunit SecG